MKTKNVTVKFRLETDLHASELAAAIALAVEAMSRALLAENRDGRYVRSVEVAGDSAASITDGSK